jgi:hypothetical protein
MTPSVRAAQGRQQQPRTKRLGSAAWRRLARMAAAGTLAAGTGVLTAALLVPAAASAASSQTWTGGGDGTTWGDPMNWASHSVPQNGDSVTIPGVRFPARTVVTGMPSGTQLQDLTMTDVSLSGGDVTVAGNFSWSVSQGFEILGSPLTVEGDASIGGAGEQDVSQPMTFDGTAEFNGPGLISIQDAGPAITNNGVLTVAPGAVARGSVCCVNPDVVRNNGTVAMTAAGTGNLANMEFNDQGSVVVGPGSLLDITGGPGAFGAGSDVTGGGTLQFEMGASMTLATGISIGAGSTVTLTGNAEFFGPGTFVGGGKFSWSGGTIDGSLDVGKSIHATVSGTTTKSLTSGGIRALLAFHGPTTVQGSGPLEAFAADISSSGAFTIRTGAKIDGSTCCVNPDEFLSTGTLTVPGSSGKASVAFMNFNDQGNIVVGAGSTLLDTSGPGSFGPGVILSGGGTVDFDQGATITLGSSMQIQTGTSLMLAGGTVAPSTTGGVLKITGGYNQTSAGTLSSVITGTTPGTKFGQLSVGGKATLAGTLKVNTGNGFVPGHGQSFSVLLYHTRSGMFGTLTGTPAYTVNYAATAANVVYP